jgi:hypothetical protein
MPCPYKEDMDGGWREKKNGGECGSPPSFGFRKMETD